MEEFNKELIEEPMEVVVENIIEPAVSNKNGLIGLAVGLGVTVVAGVGAWLLNKKGKFEEAEVRRLEKKGYVIQKPEAKEEEPEKEAKKIEIQ
jgi:hypothetical protein